jgi:hypothetical protein
MSDAVMKPATVLHYRERGDRFLHAAIDLETLDHERHAPAVGLLAVHACNALADAILVAVEGARAQGEDHGEASRRLRAWCSAKRLAEGGIKHFEWLLGKKNTFSYDDRRVEANELRVAKVKMEQFFSWALRTFPPVARINEAGDA